MPNIRRTLVFYAVILFVLTVFTHCKPDDTSSREPGKPGYPPARYEQSDPDRIRSADFPEEPVREAVFQGSWYPGTGDKLRSAVNAYLKKAEKPSLPPGTKPRILISPHAGYVFCARTAAHAFKALEGHSYDTVVLAGLCHRYPLDRISVYKQGSYRNCLGSLRINTELAQKLISADDGITYVPQAHAQEHSLEILLPFIPVILGDVPIVPVLVQTDDPQTPAKLAQALHKAAHDTDILLVISTDLSHYPDAQNARRADAATVESWKTLDPENIKKTSEKQLAQGIADLGCTMCAEQAVLAGFTFAKLRNIPSIKVTHMSNSAGSSGDTSRTVGYASAVLYSRSSDSSIKGKNMSDEFLSETSKKELLAIARASVERAVSKKPLPDDKSGNPQLQKKTGCFVTLKNSGELRGCIGCFESDQPLYATVRKYAAMSATRDMRFFNNPITPREVPDLTVEISVLTPMKKVENPEKEIKLGTHGIYIKKGARGGTFLPQVATEHNMSLDEFLGSCCSHKAGLAPDAWKTDPDVEVYTYEAIVFQEQEDR